MCNQTKLYTPEEARLRNIIDVGLTASAMIRLFKKRTKEEKLRKRVYDDLKRIFAAKSREDFDKIHSEFCDWGAINIFLAKKDKRASYGQVAKTLNVVLKVAIYYSHLPDCEKSRELSEWLHAALDTKMMDCLNKWLRSKHCPECTLPKTIEGVDKDTYRKIRKVVDKFIKEKHAGSITPVEFEEIYWRKLNREEKEEVS
jgi:hypothetical protein